MHGNRSKSEILNLVVFNAQEDGTALGFKEFKLNTQRIKDGFSRSKVRVKLQDEIEKEVEALRKMEKN